MASYEDLDAFKACHQLALAVHTLTEGLDEIDPELSAQLWRWMRETDDPLLKGPVASPRYRLAMDR